MVVGKIKAGQVGSLAASVALALAMSGVVTPTPGLADTCANEVVRDAQTTTFLPECRAYELVSPPGATVYLNPNGGVEGARAAAASTSSGSAIGWFSYYPPPGFDSDGMQLVSLRTGSGWSTQEAIPQQSTNSGALLGCGGYVYLSSELTKGILADGQRSIGAEQGAQQLCGRNEPSLVEGEPEGFQNLFVHEIGRAAYSLVNVTPGGVVPSDAHLQAFATDFSRVVFSESARLTDDAPSGEVLYEWGEGSVHLVSVLPDGEPVPGRLVDGQSSVVVLSFAPFMHGVSSDGSRVFFEAEGNLYLRENADQAQSTLGPKDECLEQKKACTLKIDTSVAGGVGGGGGFVAANEDGTTVFFTDGGVAKLTADTVATSGPNLYEFDVSTGQLTDLTPSTQVDVRGFVGFGEETGNAERLYVVAKGVLSGANVEGQAPQAGANNLYEIVPGQSPVFVATLAAADAGDWQNEFRQAEASPNGRYLAFGSVAQLTGYDNSDVNTSAPDSELFLFDAQTGRVSCVSCAATEPPTGPSGISTTEESNALAESPGYLRRNVRDDGRVLFNSMSSLVRSDINGQSDVYEYENGQDHLISSGTSIAGSYFYEASGKNRETGQEGEDVFFASSQRLVDGDTGNGPVLYDARVNGGFVAAPTERAPCDENCRNGAQESSPPATPASLAFSGEGNPLPAASPPPPKIKKIKPGPCKKKFIRRRGKCVEKKVSSGSKAGRAKGTANGRRSRHA